MSNTDDSIIKLKKILDLPVFAGELPGIPISGDVQEAKSYAEQALEAAEEAKQYADQLYSDLENVAYVNKDNIFQGSNEFNGNVNVSNANLTVNNEDVVVESQLQQTLQDIENTIDNKLYIISDPIEYETVDGIDNADISWFVLSSDNYAKGVLSQVSVKIRQNVSASHMTKVPVYLVVYERVGTVEEDTWRRIGCSINTVTLTSGQNSVWVFDNLQIADKDLKFGISQDLEGELDTTLVIGARVSPVITDNKNYYYWYGNVFRRTVSVTLTYKTVENRYAVLSSDQTFTGTNTFNGSSVFNSDIQMTPGTKIRFVTVGEDGTLTGASYIAWVYTDTLVQIGQESSTVAVSIMSLNYVALYGEQSAYMTSSGYLTGGGNIIETTPTAVGMYANGKNGKSVKLINEELQYKFKVDADEIDFSFQDSQTAFKMSASEGIVFSGAPVLAPDAVNANQLTTLGQVNNLISSFGAGDVTAAGDNTFTGNNTFSGSVALNGTVSGNVYDKTTVDNLLSNKADSTDIDVTAAGNNTFTGDNTFTGAVDFAAATVTGLPEADVTAAGNNTFTGDNTFTGAVALNGAVSGNVYDKTTVDNLLSNKADSTDIDVTAAGNNIFTGNNIFIGSVDFGGINYFNNKTFINSILSFAEDCFHITSSSKYSLIDRGGTYYSFLFSSPVNPVNGGFPRFSVEINENSSEYYAQLELDKYSGLYFEYIASTSVSLVQLSSSYVKIGGDGSYSDITLRGYTAFRGSVDFSGATVTGLPNGDVIAAGNNTFTGDNTFSGSVALNGAVSGNVYDKTAVDNLLSTKADNTDLDAHTSNNVIHITQEEHQNLTRLTKQFPEVTPDTPDTPIVAPDAALPYPVITSYLSKQAQPGVSTAPGNIFGSRVPWARQENGTWVNNASSVDTEAFGAAQKLWDNLGLRSTPSTDTVEGTDDYIGKKWLFFWARCNYVSDQYGNKWVTAIEGYDTTQYGGTTFTTEKNVGVFGPAFWYTVKTEQYQDAETGNWLTSDGTESGTSLFQLWVVGDRSWSNLPADRQTELTAHGITQDDWKIWPGCRVYDAGDSTMKDRPYYVHAAYPGGYGVSSTGAEELVSRPNVPLRNNVSYTTMVNMYGTNMQGGAEAYVNTFGLLFDIVKNADKNSQLRYTGNVSNQPTSVMSSYTTAQADYIFPIATQGSFKVGCGVYLSASYYGNIRNIPSSYIKTTKLQVGRVKSIETRSITTSDGESVSSLCLVFDPNTVTPFIACSGDSNDSAAAAAVAAAEGGQQAAAFAIQGLTLPGETDGVIGKHDGSIISLTDSAHALRVQGTEYQPGVWILGMDTIPCKGDGTTEVTINGTVYTPSSTEYVYLVCPKGTTKRVTTGNLATIMAAGYNPIGIGPASSGGYILNMQVDGESGVAYPVDFGGPGSGSSYGHGDYIYMGGASPNEFLVGGALNNGSIGGFSAVYMVARFSDSGWDFGARD